MGMALTGILVQWRAAVKDTPIRAWDLEREWIAGLDRRRSSGIQLALNAEVLDMRRRKRLSLKHGAWIAVFSALVALLACGCELLDQLQGDTAVFVIENGGTMAVDIYLDNQLLGTAEPLAPTQWTIATGTHIARGDGHGTPGNDYNPGPVTFEAHSGEEWHWHIGDFTGRPYLDVY